MINICGIPQIFAIKVAFFIIYSKFKPEKFCIFYFSPPLFFRLLYIEKGDRL